MILSWYLAFLDQPDFMATTGMADLILTKVEYLIINLIEPI